MAKVKVVIENHQSGNVMLPGWSKKYSKLYNIPKNTAGSSAITLDIDQDDYAEVKNALNREGVGCVKFEDMPEEKQGFISNLFGPKKQKDPPKSGKERWEEVYDQLPTGTKNGFKNVNPDKISDAELEEKIAEAQKIINDSKQG